MAWDVRPTRDLDEFKRAVGSIGHYFGGWPPDDESAQRFSSNLPLERMHAAFDGDRIVGGAGAFPFELTVPGGTVACGGVTVVGVLPTHRRRGILTAMMRAQLEDIRERGEPIAALWASEEVIYRRYGYGLASLSCEMALPSGYAALREPRDDRATVRIAPLEESKDVFAAIYDRARLRTPGMFRRTDTWWETRNLPDPPERRQGGGEKNALVLELDGEPAGYALYRIHMKFEGGASVGHVDVIEAVADGPLATRELWRVLLDMDWKATLKAYLLPIDHPLVHQLTYPRRMQLRVGDGLWVRLVDVGAALSARAYADARARRGRARRRVSARERRPLADRRRRRRADRGRARPRAWRRRARLRLPRRLRLRRARPRRCRTRAPGGGSRPRGRPLPHGRAETVVRGDLLSL